MKNIYHSKRALFYGAIAHLCIAIGLAFWHIQVLVSYEVAFFTTLLVLLSSYHTMKKRLHKESNNTPSSQMPTPPTASTTSHALSPHIDTTSTSTPLDASSPPIKHAPPSTFLLGIQLSFGAYRLLSYIILVLSVMLIMDMGLFSVIGYVLGIMLCLIIMLCYIYYTYARPS